MMLTQNPTITASTASIIPSSKSLAEQVRNVVGVNVNAVRALSTVLAERVGSPDLAQVADAIADVYDADPDSHWPAAHRLAKAASDICGECDVEGWC